MKKSSYISVASYMYKPWMLFFEPSVSKEASPGKRRWSLCCSTSTGSTKPWRRESPGGRLLALRAAACAKKADYWASTVFFSD